MKQRRFQDHGTLIHHADKSASCGITCQSFSVLSKKLKLLSTSALISYTWAMEWTAQASSGVTARPCARVPNEDTHGGDTWPFGGRGAPLISNVPESFHKSAPEACHGTIVCITHSEAEVWLPLIDAVLLRMSSAAKWAQLQHLCCNQARVSDLTAIAAFSAWS